MTDKKTFDTICRMCGNLCGITVEIEGNRLVGVRGNPRHLTSKGRFCIKGSSAVEWLHHPDRLHQPLKKNDRGQFVEVELEQVMDEIAQRLLELQKRHGKRSIGVWKGEGIDFAQQEELARRFIHAVGSPNYFSNDTQCYASRYIAFHLTYGCWPQPDYANAGLIMIWGSNTPSSHPHWMQGVEEGLANKARLVVVDTRYTELARRADLYVQVRPGTDGALAWGIVQEMISRDELDRNFVDSFTIGFDKVTDYARSFTRDRAAEIAGVEPQIIESIVDAIAAARPRIVSCAGLGLEHHANGVNSIRTVAMIDALAGALDQKGGLRIPLGVGVRSLSLYDERPLEDQDPIGARQFPVLYEMRRECHTLLLMDQILSGVPYPFRGLVMTAANPVLTNANTGKVLRALSNLDLLVVKDLFMTETARLADYVIPAASYLEREELFFNGVHRAGYITGKYLDYGLQTEYAFFKGLADRMGAGRDFPWADDHELNEWLLEPTGRSTKDLHASPGGFIFGENPYNKHRTMAETGEKALPTPSGKVEFFSSYLEGKKIPGIGGLPEFVAPDRSADPDAPLLLATGARRLRYVHGRGRNVPRLRKLEPHGVLEMHPVDARRLNLEDGDRVRVTSRVGSFETHARVMQDHELRSGTLQHTHGFAQENVNQVTCDDVCDPISGFPALKDVRVRVEKISEIREV